MTGHLEQYVTYIKNTGLDGRLTTDQFDDDWEPIGPVVRRELQAARIITIYDNKISLVKGSLP
jgi:hypothetical protein